MRCCDSGEQPVCERAVAIRAGLGPDGVPGGEGGQSERIGSGRRDNHLAAADWRATLDWLREPAGRLRTVNQRAWSTALLAGGVNRLELGAQELGVDDAAVIGALLPRSGASLTLLDLA